MGYRPQPRAGPGNDEATGRVPAIGVRRGRDRPQDWVVSSGAATAAVGQPRAACATDGRAGPAGVGGCAATMQGDGPRAGRSGSADWRTAGAARRRCRLPSADRSNRVADPAGRAHAQPPQDSDLEANDPAPQGGRRGLGRAHPPVPAGGRWLAVHHRERPDLHHAYYGAQLFKDAVKAVPGVPVSTTTHDLRHHYASVLLAAGRSVIEVAERLGHENATLVLTTYGHLIHGQDDRTRQAIDDAWTGQADAAPSQPRPQEAQ